MADYKIIMSGNSGAIKLPESSEPQTDFVSHTFTNCGKTGRYGPSLANCQGSYSGAEILEPDYNFNVSNGIQYWTVPATASYEITAAGAKGGDESGNQYYGGNGSIMSGTFQLVEGVKLKILVGQKGGDSNSSNVGGGGGGGTFVAKLDNTSLIVAGGGGGASRSAGNSPGDGGDAPIDNTGNGGGIMAGTYGNGNGAGFVGNGESALSFINNGVGGDKENPDYTYYTPYSGYGGFGGGAGNSVHLGGGAGGYNGGNGGTFDIKSEGGGSFNSGQNQSNQAGSNSDHGYVVIKLL